MRLEGVRFAERDPALEPAQLNALYTVVGWSGSRTDAKTGELLARSRHFVAAWQGETLVGFGRLLEDVYWAQILDVMVHPGFRRRGIAREVVSRLVAYADAANLSLMLISAGSATRLYRSFGFEAANPRTDVLMYRALPAATDSS